MGFLYRGHVPLVRLEQPELPLDDGVLRRLSFEEWHAVDDSFPYSKRHYDQTEPVFLEVRYPEAAVGDESDLLSAFQAGLDPACRALRRLYEALLLCTTARLPTPDLSTTYLVDDRAAETTGVVTARSRVGPCNTELIVFGGQLSGATLDERNVVEVLQMRSRLETQRSKVEPLVESLVRTTRPGFGVTNEAFHLVAGLEALLVEKGEPPGETFARRYAVLVAEEDPRRWTEFGRALYRLRSQLVHGRELDTEQAEDREEYLRSHNRYEICTMGRRALIWYDAHPRASSEDFHLMLDAACEPGPQWDAFRSLVGDTS